jgi:hypothetical protein
MTTELPNLDAAVYAMLSGHEPLTDEIDMRIGHGLAEDGWELPYLVYGDAGLFPQNRQPIRMHDAVYSFDIAYPYRDKPLGSKITKIVFNLLHDQKLIFTGEDSDWYSWWMSVQRTTNLTDIVNGEKFRRTILDVEMKVARRSL